MCAISRWRELRHHAVLRPLSAVALFAAWLRFCPKHGFASGYGGLGVVTAVGLVPYVVPAWCFGLDGPEKSPVCRRPGRAVTAGRAALWPPATAVER